MKPTLGRIVIYKFNSTPSGLGGHQLANGAEEAPAVVVRVWSDTCVNLKVLVDGPYDVWITSATEGSGYGNWHWPVREQASAAS